MHHTGRINVFDANRTRSDGTEQLLGSFAPDRHGVRLALRFAADFANNPPAVFGPEKEAAWVVFPADFPNPGGQYAPIKVYFRDTAERSAA